MPFEVALRPETFELTATRLVTGIIFVKADGLCFPDHRWSDFPLVILSWWLGEIGTISVGSETILRFMEGPYQLEVKPAAEELLSVRFVKNGLGDLGEVGISAADFCSSIIGAAETAVAECDRRRWVTEDSVSLRSALASV